MKFNDYYYVCVSEKRIYHTLPKFVSNQDKEQMFELGITKQERWVKMPLSKILALCAQTKPHYAFSAYTTNDYEIIDCPELKDYQCSLNIFGIYLPMVGYSPILDTQENEPFVDILELEDLDVCN